MDDPTALALTPDRESAEAELDQALGNTGDETHSRHPPSDEVTLSRAPA